MILRQKDDSIASDEDDVGDNANPDSGDGASFEVVAVVKQHAP